MNPDRPSPPLSAPDRLFLDFQAALAGRYSLERELGRGGMGVVYLAREVRLDRPVAIKLLPPRLAAEPSLRERFVREARTAAKLSHPNIVPIYSVDEAAGHVFYAMAYVDGETLTERVRRRGPVAASDATRMLRDIAWALGYAHAQGVVHRDVKPDNILLEAGTDRALVADFGIAAVVREASGADGGVVTGTPEFMSPEQVLGEPVDGRSDLYALGVLAYFAISARLPFQADTATEVLAKQVTEAPRPLAEIADGVPRRLVQLVEQCLAKDREARPADAGVVADRLRAALEQRRELPVPLRVFVKRGARISGMGGLVYLMFGLPILTTVGAALGEGTGALLAFGARAQDYPTKPITMIVAFPPGGVAELVGRPLAASMEKTLGQPVIILNRPGAGGAVGTTVAAKAAPDGYTILMTLSSISIFPVSDPIEGKPAPYQISDFMPIALVTADPTVLVVRADSPYKTVQDFIAAAKANPGKINYSSSGVYGTSATSRRKRR